MKWIYSDARPERIKSQISASKIIEKNLIKLEMLQMCFLKPTACQSITVMTSRDAIQN